MFSVNKCGTVTEPERRIFIYNIFSGKSTILPIYIWRSILIINTICFIRLHQMSFLIPPPTLVARAPLVALTTFTLLHNYFLLNIDTGHF